MRKFAVLVQLVWLLMFSSLGCHSSAGVGDTPDDLYVQCDGNTFYPNGACASERCVPEGLAAKVFQEWKRQFMLIHKLSEGMFAKRIEISSVEIKEGPIYVWWRVDYVFMLDWVRSRHADSVNLGDYPLKQEPDQDAIARVVKFAIRETDKFAIPEVVARSVVEKSLQSCDAGMKADWCHIRFENRTGRLLVEGRTTINDAGNQCKRVDVDLATGQAVYCANQPCRISLNR
jgi:hypothetical protein